MWRYLSGRGRTVFMPRPRTGKPLTRPPGSPLFPPGRSPTPREKWVATVPSKSIANFSLRFELSNRFYPPCRIFYPHNNATMKNLGLLNLAKFQFFEVLKKRLNEVLTQNWIKRPGFMPHPPWRLPVRGNSTTWLQNKGVSWQFLYSL